MKKKFLDKNLGRKTAEKVIFGVHFFVLFIFIFSLLPINFVSATAGVPQLINFQGRLLDNTGNLLGGPSGTDYCFKFSIYDATTGGSKIWPSGAATPGVLVVREGVFDGTIGAVDTLDLAFIDDQAYVNVAVSAKSGTCDVGETGESYENLSPRPQIVSSGFAINSKTVGGFTPAQSATNNQIPVLTAGTLILGHATTAGIASSATNALSITSGTTGVLTLDSGTTGAVNLGTGNNAKTINIGTGTAGNTINIGTNNAVSDAISIGSALDTLAITGSSASSFVFNAIDVSATEFNVLEAGIERGDLTTQGAATDEYCLTSEASGGALLEWQVCGSSTLQNVYDNDVDGSDATVTLSTADDSLVISNPTSSGTDSAFTFKVNQQHTTGVVSAIDVIQASNAANAINLTANAIDTETALAITANGLTSGTGINFSSNSDGSTGQKGLNIALLGTNGAGGQTTYGAYISNTHGGSGTDVGLYVTASGGTNNYAAIFDAGNVGIGITAPTSILHIQQFADSAVTATPVGFDLNSSGATGELTASSGVQTFARIAPTLNQTSTAGYTALLINATETATGSGAKLLQDWQVGGVSKAKIDSAGALTVTSCSGCGGGTIQNSYDNDVDGSDATVTLSTADDSLVISNPTSSGTDSAFTFKVNQQHTTGVVSAIDVIQASNAANAINLTANAIDTETALAITANGLTSGTGINFSSNSDGSTGQKGLNIALSGVNGAGAQTTYGAYISNTHGGSGTDIGLYATASGGTNNYAAIFDAGNVGIGDTSPDATLDIDSSVTTGINFGITNTGIYTGTGLLSVVADSATTGTIQTTSATGLTTGKAENITLGSALTTGGAISVTGASYNHGAAQVGSIGSFAFSDVTSGAFASTSNGLLVSPTVNITAGAATKTINGISIEPTFTACTTATCNVNGVNLGNVTDSGNFTSTALKIGTGWDNIFSNGTYSLTSAGVLTVASCSGCTTITADSLDFDDFVDSMTVDAATDINLGAFALTIDLDSTGDFSIRDVTTDIATFADSGAITFAPTSGQNLTNTLAGAGTFTLNSGVTTGATTASAFAGNFNALTTGTGMYLASSTLSSGTLLDLSSNGTDALTGQKILNVDLSGNIASGQTTYGAYISNNYIGGAPFGSTNYALYATATGGNLNRAAKFDQGNVSIGDTDGFAVMFEQAKLEVKGDSDVGGYVLHVEGGDAVSTGQAGQSILFRASQGATNIMGDGQGGSIIMSAGSAGSGASGNTGGSIVLNGGDDTLGGNHGNVILADSIGGVTVGSTTATSLFNVGSSAQFQVNSSGDIITPATEALSITTGTTGALTLTSGTTGTVNLGTGNNAKTINIATGTAGNTINIGTDNTTLDTIAIGSALDTLTFTGSSSSSFVLNAVNVSAAEFNVLDAGIERGDLTTQGTATDEYCLTSETGGGALLAWQACDAAITADSLDFDDFVDSMTVDAATDINLGAFALTIDLDSTGDFSIRDVTTDIATFADSGAITFAPTSGQSLTNTLAGAGTFTLNSGVTTGATTASAFAGNFNALTTGTGMYLASSTLSTGSLLDLTVSGTAGASSQKALNISTSGAVTGSNTTYGGYISNTHTGVSAINVGLYVEASGATSGNYAAVFPSGDVGIGTSLPLTKFDIVRSTGGVMQVLRSNNVSSSSTLHIGGINGSGDPVIVGVKGDSAGSLILQTGSTNSNYITEGTDRITILSTGNVGIGDSSPAGLFTVGSGDKFQIDASGDVATPAAEALSITTGTTGALTLTSGTTGTVNLGTGNNAKTINIATGTAGNTINIGTDNTVSDTIAIGSLLDNVSIVGDDWNITSGGVLTVVSCSGCGGVTADSLDFDDFMNSMTIDEATDINLGALAFTIDLDSTGDFSIRDVTTDIATFADSGAITFAPTSGQNLTNTLAGAGTFAIDSGVTNGTTTTSAFTLSPSALTSGTGLYAVAGNSFTSGKLVDIQVSSTGSLTNQTALNVLTTGVNGTGAQTTYGAKISNTHSGTSTNVALYATATGGTNNYSGIFEAGSVGIGTTAPINLLDIVNGTQNTGTSGSGANPGAFGMTSADIVLTGGGAQAFLSSNSAWGIDKGGSLGFGGLYGAGTPTNDATFAKIKGAKETAGAGNLGGYLAFATYNHNAGALAERMRIDSGGQVGIGDSGPDNMLDVHNATAQSAIAITSLGTDTDALIKFELTDNSPLFSMGIDDSDSDKFKISTTALGTNDRLVIDSSGNLVVGVLDTDLTAPTTSGTTKMVITDANGQLSFTTIPSGVSDADYGDITVSSAGAVWSVDSGAVLLNELGAAGGSNTINNAANAQEWQWNSLAGGTGFKLSSTSTAAASDTQKLFEISTTGTNGTAGETTYGAYISNTHDGTTSTNVALYATASGATVANSNYAGVFENGRVLIGTASETASSSKLYITNTLTTETGSTTAIAGLHENFTFDSDSGTNTQVGNRLMVTNTGSAASTAIGQIIRMVDNSVTLANTIRGIEVVSNAGSNVTGINTGIRTTGSTFGLEALTDGAAGGTSGPAAIFGQNTGDTQGDVLRLYTTSMTSAPRMAYFLHSGSTWTGTGLLMDFANTTGTFTGNFADFQNNTVSRFKIKSTGATAITATNTTEVTTASALALNVNALTTGTGLYAASSTLSTGMLVDLQVSGTAGDGSKALNISTSGTNAGSNKTTYGAYISNTHAGTGATNVGLYSTASGGATNQNYAGIFDAGFVGINTTAPTQALEIGGSTNFGGMGVAGAFIDRNSYYGDELNKERTDLTADGAAPTWGDNQDWVVGETGTCVWAIDDDAVNGISSVNAGTTDDVCVTYLGDNATTTGRLIFDADNLPVYTSKVRFTVASTGAPDDNHYFWTGLSDLASLTSTEGSAIDAAKGLFFSNCSSTNQESSGGTDCNGNIYGVARNGSDGTTSVTSSCGAIDETKFMYFMVKVVSTASVEYWVDLDVSNGITPTLCGTLTTNIPTTGLSGLMGTAWDQGSNASNLEVDYFRVWQDDPPTDALVDNSDSMNAPIDVNFAPTSLDGRVALVDLMVATENIEYDPGARIDTETMYASKGMVTPELWAKNVFTDIISPGTGSDVGMILGTDGKFYIGMETLTTNEDGTTTRAPGQTLFSLDAEGNATFAGNVTAKGIQIVGLEGITEELNQLSESQTAFTLTAEAMNALSQAMTLAEADLLKLQTDLGMINETVAGLVASGVDMESRMATIESLLSANAFDGLENISTNTLDALGTATFLGGVKFDSQAEFTMPPIFNKDTAGFAMINSGDRRVRVEFDEPYAATPVVASAITYEATDNIDDTEANDLFAADIRFIVTEKDETGFTIIINKNAPRNIRFSWIALGVRDPKIFESLIEGLIIESEPTPEIIPEPAPSSPEIIPEPEATPEIIPEPEATPEIISEPTPEIISEPTPEPAPSSPEPEPSAPSSDSIPTS